MTKVSKLSKIKKTPTNNILLFVGVILAVVWPILIGATNLQVNLPCAIGQNSCTEGTTLAQAILYIPVIIGSFALSAGTFSKVKMRHELKSFLTFISAIVMCVISLLIIIFTTAAVYGLGA